MSRQARILVSIGLAIGYLLAAYVFAEAILSNTGTCEGMAICEDVKTPGSVTVTVMATALAPFVLLAVLLVRWIASPVPPYDRGGKEKSKGR